MAGNTARNSIFGLSRSGAWAIAMIRALPGSLDSRRLRHSVDGWGQSISVSVSGGRRSSRKGRMAAREPVAAEISRMVAVSCSCSVRPARKSSS
ncbi:hypothetical protein D9M72_624170 [compost metagenome]